MCDESTTFLARMTSGAAASSYSFNVGLTIISSNAFDLNDRIPPVERTPVADGGRQMNLIESH